MITSSVPSAQSSVSSVPKDMRDSLGLPMTLRTHSPEGTERLGSWLGGLLRAGDVVCLHGGLGAGKTCLCRGIGAGFGAQTPITSPSYTLVHEHRRGRDSLILYHLDCYRLADAEDAQTIAIDDILDGGGAVLIEWARRIETALPAERLEVGIAVCGDMERELRFVAHGERHKALLDGLRRKMEAGA